MRHSAILRTVTVVGLTISILGCGASPISPTDDQDLPDVSEAVPLPDLGASRYLGFEGGLYPQGANTLPADHLARGLAQAAKIRPLDADGRPDPAGRAVLISVGMSNTSQEFCGRIGSDCLPFTFAGLAETDPRVERDRLVIVNGAQGGQDADDWDATTDLAYDRARDDALGPLGLSELQVRVVWLKQAHSTPTFSLPSPDADAYALVRNLGEIVRTLADRYPNLELVFVSSRTYGGYATTPLNPEPYAYESGFAVKWLVEAQIRQARTGEVDPLAGDLDPTRVPWIGWGPYLWTAGQEGRSDGLTWLRSDVVADGTHPSESGERKVAELLLDFFVTSPIARCWFIADESCGG